jgi:hypothetical protein
MIHVGVRQQDQIDWRQATHIKGRLDKTLDTQSHDPKMNARARTEDRIGKDRDAIHHEEYGTVAEPGSMYPAI